MKKKICVIWANPWNKNLGVSALAYSSLHIISNIVNQYNIDLEVTLLGCEKNGIETIDIGDGHKINVETFKCNDFYGLKGFVKSLIRWKDYRLDLIKNQDVILDIGEGDSFSDIYGIERFNRVLGSKIFFGRMGLTQVLMPQTIGPFRNGKVQKKAVDVMGNMNYLLPRDAKSYSFAYENVNNKNIKESLDMAFFLPFEKKSFEGDNIEVGINVSGLMWNGGYTKNNQFNLKVQYPELIESIIKLFLNYGNIRVHLVSHVIPDSDENIESDYGVAKFLCDKYKGLVNAPKFTSPIEAKSYISGLDFFLGARMHSCIAAFSSGVPVVPMAYSRKFSGLFIDTLKYEHMVDMMTEDNERVINIIKDKFESKEMLKATIEYSQTMIIKPRQQELQNIISEIIINA